MENPNTCVAVAGPDVTALARITAEESTGSQTVDTAGCNLYVLLTYKYLGVYSPFYLRK